MQKINKRTLFLSFIFILMLLVVALLIGRFTYSYLGADVSDDVEGIGEVTASGDTIIFTKGNSLSLKATTDNFKTGGDNLTDTTNPKVKLMASSKTNSASSKYFAGVIIKNNTYQYTTTGKSPEVILTVKDENGNIIESSADNLKFVTVNNNLKGFDITGVNGAFNIVTDHIIATESGKTQVIHTWTFTITFVNLGTDQSNNENASLSMDVVLQKNKLLTSLADVCTSSDTLSNCVVKGYNEIGDLLNLYYHDSNLENGAGDNSYRYAGASEYVNNYVCFGNDKSDCPVDNLYRIIGVFDGRVKLIKEDYVTNILLGTDGDFKMTYSYSRAYYKGSLTSSELGWFMWNLNANNSISNTWSTSLLNKTNLNTNYLNNMGSKWSSMIDTTTWKVGGNTYQNIYQSIPSVTYQNEIVNPVTTNSTDNATEYSAKVGLMYVSDYGFAADPSAWTTILENYDDTSITSKNWMYMGLKEHTISRVADDSYYVFYVSYRGSVNLNEASSVNAVRPVFFLSSSVKFSSGDGSANNPIRIKL